ncbi:MAG: hypothetical protein AB7I18_03505 [Candidatus Berkiella sp.]
MTNTYLYICQTNIAKTCDISLLSLTPLAEALPYQAGQYVEILLRSGESLLLSIANAPTEHGQIEFHLRHDSSHPLAQLFLRELSEAPTAVLRGPFGVSTLEAASMGDRLIFVAGGTGFAPIKALLETALPENRPQLILYWGIKRPEDAYEIPLLEKWKQHYPHFDYTLVLSDPAFAATWPDPTGLVHDHVARMHTNMKDLCLFASGPYEMIKRAQDLFSLNGLPHDRFISDMATKPV